MSDDQPDDTEVASLDDQQVAPLGERETPCEFVCGIAGSGKTFEQVAKVAANPSYGVLAATTGIASVNLGAITIHSLLRYSTTSVLRDHYLNGSLGRILHAIALRVRRIIIDEVSMADGEQLDLWSRGVAEANRYADVTQPLGITLVGDFAQLPPVKAKWAFEAACWGQFARNTRRLEKSWRQDGGSFLNALNLVRCGQGAAGAEVLQSAGARFESMLDTEFEGTTILPKNDMVSRFNMLALDRVKGASFTVASRRWGQQRSEWGMNQRSKEWGIPQEIKLKLGAYVMILANAADFSYVNGDCGWVKEYDEAADAILIQLVRTGEVIWLPRIVRGVEFSERPDGFSGGTIPRAIDDGEWIPRQHYRGKVRRWVTGQVEYFPLRLAYATTVHKSQSLTLDRVQVDYRGYFFAQPAMLYVALSRCRTLEGLRLVGQPEVFAKHCNFDPRVAQWL